MLTLENSYWIRVLLQYLQQMRAPAFVKTMQFIMNGSRQTYALKTFNIIQTFPRCIHRCTIVTFYIFAG